MLSYRLNMQLIASDRVELFSRFIQVSFRFHSGNLCKTIIMPDNDSIAQLDFNLSPLQYKLYAVLFAALVLLFEIPYVLITYVILATKSFRTQPFYKFVNSLALADQIVLLIQLFYCVPLTWQGTHSENLAIEFISSVAIGAVPINIFFIAFNRYVAICLHQKYDQIFSGKSLKTANFEFTTFPFQGLLPICFQQSSCCFQAVLQSMLNRSKIDHK